MSGIPKEAMANHSIKHYGLQEKYREGVERPISKSNLSKTSHCAAASKSCIQPVNRNQTDRNPTRSDTLPNTPEGDRPKAIASGLADITRPRLQPNAATYKPGKLQTDGRCIWLVKRSIEKNKALRASRNQLLDPDGQ